MKQVDATLVNLKDSIRPAAVKSDSVATKESQQDLLKKRAEMLKKQIESLRAKTSADMVRFDLTYSNLYISNIDVLLILASRHE